MHDKSGVTKHAQNPTQCFHYMILRTSSIVFPQINPWGIIKFGGSMDQGIKQGIVILVNDGIVVRAGVSMT